MAVHTVANLVEFPVLPGSPADPNYSATSRAIELAFGDRMSGEWKREAARSLAVALHDRDRRISQGLVAGAFDRVTEVLAKDYMSSGMPRMWAELAARKEARTYFRDEAAIASSE